MPEDSEIMQAIRAIRAIRAQRNKQVAPVEPEGPEGFWENALDFGTRTLPALGKMAAGRPTLPYEDIQRAEGAVKGLGAGLASGTAALATLPAGALEGGPLGAYKAFEQHGRLIEEPLRRAVTSEDALPAERSGVAQGMFIGDILAPGPEIGALAKAGGRAAKAATGLAEEAVERAPRAIASAEDALVEAIPALRKRQLELIAKKTLAPEETAELAKVENQMGELRRAANDPEVEASLLAEALPAEKAKASGKVSSGETVRVYRGEGSAPFEWSDPEMNDMRGRWFTTDQETARYFADSPDDLGRVIAVDVPREVFEKSKVPYEYGSGQPDRVSLPPEWVSRASVVEDLRVKNGNRRVASAPKDDFVSAISNRMPPPEPPKVKALNEATPTPPPAAKMQEIGQGRIMMKPEPEVLRQDLGAAGRLSYKKLMEGKRLYEQGQYKDQHIITAATRKLSESESEDAYRILDETLDKNRLAVASPKARQAAQWAKKWLRARGEALEASGVKVPDGDGNLVPFKMKEGSYAPRISASDPEAGFGLATRYRMPGLDKTHLQRRAAEEAGDINRNLREVLTQYADETNDILAHYKAFGKDPKEAVDELAAMGFEEGVDANYLRNALDHQLGGGPQALRAEEAFTRRFSQVLVNMTLPFSGPAQISQIPPIVTKAGYANTTLGMGRILKAMVDPVTRAQILRPAVTFESFADIYRSKYRLQKTIDKALDATTQVTLKNPAGAAPLDAFSRVLASATSRPYADDLVGQIAKGGKKADRAKKVFDEAGLDAEGIAKRGKLSEDEYDKFAWDFARERALPASPGDNTYYALQNKYTRLHTILTRFTWQQFQQFKKDIVLPMREGNFAPLMRSLPAAAAAGFVNQAFADMVYNKDQQGAVILDAIQGNPQAALDYVNYKVGDPESLSAWTKFAIKMWLTSQLALLYQAGRAIDFGAEDLLSGAAIGKGGQMIDAAVGLGRGAIESAQTGSPDPLSEAATKAARQYGPARAVQNWMKEE